MIKKFISCLVISLCLGAMPAQEPVSPTLDKLYAEFITDCNWLIHNAKNKVKIKAAVQGTVGFRAWEYMRGPGDIVINGLAVWRNIGLWTRDYLLFSNSAYIGEFVVPPMLYGWDYVIHYGKNSSGLAFPNAGGKLRVVGPCELVTLYHGEAMITHGNHTFYVKVDEYDYANYPPWSINLK